MGAPASDSDSLTWELRVPLLAEPHIVGPIAGVILGASLGMAVLLSGLFLLQGESDAIGSIWMATAATGAGLFLLVLFVMVVVFGNRMHCRYRIDRRAVRYELLDRRAGAMRRLAMALGLVTGSPQLAGAGLIAESQAVEELAWRGAFRAEYVPRRHLIVLRNAWRRVLLIHCTADNYVAVAARVAAEMARHGTDGRVAARSPLPRYLAWSAAVTLATLPLFALTEEFDVSLLLPLLQLAFGLAAVWLAGLCGYVVIAVDAVMAAALLRQALVVQASWLRPGEYFARWTVYSAGDWTLLAMAAAGMALLAWIGWRAARGRFVPMLQADLEP